MINCIILEDDYSSALDIQVKLIELGCKVKEIIIFPDDELSSDKFKDVDLLISDVKLSNTKFAFDILKNFKKLPPIIFISSYGNNDLLEACNKLNPYIYLTKPVDSIVLKSAIHGALKGKRSKRNDEISISGQNVFIRSKGKLTAINPSMIKFVHSEGNYCYIHFEDGSRKVIRSSLLKILEKMNYDNLFQVHRAYVVNKNFIDNVNIGENLLIVGDLEIPIGGKFKKGIFSELDVI